MDGKTKGLHTQPRRLPGWEARHHRGRQCETTAPASPNDNPLQADSKQPTPPVAAPPDPAPSTTAPPQPPAFPASAYRTAAALHLALSPREEEAREVRPPALRLRRPGAATPAGAGAGSGKESLKNDKPILAGGGARCFGVKKALVFYQGRSPRRTKTEWIMHEYRLLQADAGAARHRPHDFMRLDDWVLCRIRRKGDAVAPDADGESGAAPSQVVAPAAAATAEVHVGGYAFGGFGDDWADGQLPDRRPSADDCACET
ncbi:hypothetical protein QYE76_051706 [Lolium multiflorum]|uniref:NAC domain-containing protein n=1 Tax=Lolium multiflorum TaxID=4521 RepID=A0AAD8WI56_LOLMU|nr:hypothetical protein QYE76_051706 [Lolium multiflorum]